jgi:hypothetical protein
MKKFIVLHVLLLSSGGFSCSFDFLHRCLGIHYCILEKFCTTLQRNFTIFVIKSLYWFNADPQYWSGLDVFISTEIRYRYLMTEGRGHFSSFVTVPYLYLYRYALFRVRLGIRRQGGRFFGAFILLNVLKIICSR